MDHETQLALIDRIQAHRARGRGTDTAPRALAVATDAYTKPDRLAAERKMMATAPTVVSLSGALPEPGSYATATVGDRSIIVTRNQAGQVAAMLNVCRHRGAEVALGCGRAQRLSCPYHAWTYNLDGSLASRRREEYFTDIPETGLTQLPVLEQDGLIWVCPDPDAEMPHNPLYGAEAELRPFGLSSFRLFDSTEFSRPINWKLAVDTFCESYHLPILHRETLGPLIHDDFALFNTFGPHGRFVAVRKSISQLDSLDRSQWSLLPHATILWFLVPNAVLIYQQDHAQLYQARPGSHPGEAHLNVSLYVPPESEESEEHWRKNFELLVSVTDAEDFTTAAGQQRGFATPAQDHIVFGRNEPALQHYHQALDSLID